MKLMLVRTMQGTFLGEVKIVGVDLDLSTLHYPVMVDFITVPSMSPLGKPEVKTILHLSDWPSSEMKLDGITVLHSILDSKDDSTTDLGFINAYKGCVAKAWKGWNARSGIVN